LKTKQKLCWKLQTKAHSLAPQQVHSRENQKSLGVPPWQNPKPTITTADIKRRGTTQIKMNKIAPDRKSDKVESNHAQSKKPNASDLETYPIETSKVEPPPKSLNPKSNQEWRWYGGINSDLLLVCTPPKQTELLFILIAKRERGKLLFIANPRFQINVPNIINL